MLAFSRSVNDSHLSCERFVNESSDLRSSPFRDESRSWFPNVNAVVNQGTAYRPLDLGRYVGKGLELGRCPGL